MTLLGPDQAPLLAKPFYEKGDPGPIVAALAPSISIMTDANLSSDWQRQLHDIGMPLTLVNVPAGAS